MIFFYFYISFALLRPQLLLSGTTHHQTLCFLLCKGSKARHITRTMGDMISHYEPKKIMAAFRNFCKIGYSFIFSATFLALMTSWPYSFLRVKRLGDDGHTGIKKISDRKKSNSLKGIGSSGNPEYFKLNTLKQI